MTWVRVAPSSEIAPDKGFSVNVGDNALAVYRIGRELFAVEDICPHAGGLLSEGFLDGDKIECPLHQALFHIPTGKCMASPADRDLTTFAVKIEGDSVFVDV